MRRTKMEKGITLVALIITIVLLLILASVAINSITDAGIINKAQNVAEKYNEAVSNEEDILDEYIGYLNGVEKITVNTIAKSLSTINGKTYSNTNPVIPAGFKAINTETSSWEAKNLAEEVKKGLVISDKEGNEFVWIPVSDINSFAILQDGSETNYRGIRYDFSSTEATESIHINEPTNIYADNVDKFTTIDWNENYYQETFNKMVKSVAKYKGFYVGRYEMSYNTTTNKAQSLAGAKSIYHDSDENDWWGLYEKAKTFGSNGVISEMIWGCQFDAIFRWMQENNIDVMSATPIDTNRNVTTLRNSDKNRITGSSNKDLLNNIYDLLGNSCEYTQARADEAKRTFIGRFIWLDRVAEYEKF